MKTLLAILVTLAICFGLCACSSTTEQAITPQDDNAISHDVQEETPNMVEEQEETEAKTQETVLIDDATQSAIGEAAYLEPDKTVTIDGLVKLTLKDSYIVDEIIPSAPDASYSYMADEEGSVYFVVEGVIENIGSLDIVFDTTAVGPSGAIVTNFFVNDTYVYSGRWVTEEPDGSSLRTSLAAGDTSVLYIFAAVPDDVVDDTEDITGLLIGFHDFEETVVDFIGNVDWDACTYKFYVE